MPAYKDLVSRHVRLESDLSIHELHGHQLRPIARKLCCYFTPALMCLASCCWCQLTFSSCGSELFSDITHILYAVRCLHSGACPCRAASNHTPLSSLALLLCFASAGFTPSDI